MIGTSYIPRSPSSLTSGYNSAGQPLSSATLSPFLSAGAQQPKSSSGSIPLPPTNLFTGKFTSPFLGDTASGVVDTLGRQVGVGQSVSGPFTGAEPFTKGTSGGLSSSFTPANAVGGFAGNFLGNSLFGGDRGIGADIGGAVGGLAGSTLIGQAVIPIPGVGAALGALAGNALGGLFGGPKPNPFATWHNYDVGYNPDGSLKGQAALKSKHMSGDFGAQMGNTVTGINQKLHQLTGLDMSGVKNITGYEKNYGGFIAFNSPFHKDAATYNPDTVFYFDPKKPEQQQEALKKYARSVIDWNNNAAIKAGQQAPVQNPDEVIAQLFAPEQPAGTQLGTTPLVKQSSGTGNETYANFMKRYRETGDINPRLGKNTG